MQADEPAQDPRSAKIARDLDQIDRVARLMDARFGLPFTPFRFGLDSVVGLVPVIGDLAGSAPAIWMLTKGWQHGARRRVLLQMAANSGIDFALGSVPIIGDLFDAGYKANLKNAALLRRELQRGVTPEAPRPVKPRKPSKSPE